MLTPEQIREVADDLIADAIADIKDRAIYERLEDRDLTADEAAATVDQINELIDNANVQIEFPEVSR